ncbi:hypothetical protein [Parasedimentitalea psychrophila]|uniref:Transposase n=1 Tax=Parasedimentitalea psychrophila TaxID=2997337 RepID=A0A9Y2P6I0_9RHOB|nr:hypothetical protein [Parasedimentitalea psychrophila]WIY25023.1 hypothetical protein QPJ95_21460 [Parasedimentitalea psychrophila]
MTTAANGWSEPFLTDLKMSLLEQRFGCAKAIHNPTQTFKRELSERVFHIDGCRLTSSRRSHQVSAVHLLADRAFDADWLRNDLMDRDIILVMPPKPTRKVPAEFDKETHKWRHLIEKYFGNLKKIREIAKRSCRANQSVKALISIAATIIHSR